VARLMPQLITQLRTRDLTTKLWERQLSRQRAPQSEMMQLTGKICFSVHGACLRLDAL